MGSHKNASELPVSWPRLELGTSEYMWHAATEVHLKSSYQSVAMRNNVETGTASNPKGGIYIYILSPHRTLHGNSAIKQLKSVRNCRAIIWLLWDIATRHLETDTGYQPTLK
jgi:hypothetical protein